MTLQEENKQLREQLKEYEALIEKMIDGPYTSGTIISKDFLTVSANFVFSFKAA